MPKTKPIEQECRRKIRMMPSRATLGFCIRKKNHEGICSPSWRH